jgi:uncharacterized membrane protein YhaH (DUF805 family)
MQWYLAAFRKYAVFSGRARRTEYWTFTVINVAIAFALSFIGTMLGIGGVAVTGDATGAILGAITGLLLPIGWLLVTLLPSIAVGVRRLHDTNRSGWWLWIGLVPGIGAVVLLVLMLIEGTPGANEYGENPKTGMVGVAMA